MIDAKNIHEKMRAHNCTHTGQEFNLGLGVCWGLALVTAILAFF